MLSLLLLPFLAAELALAAPGSVCSKQPYQALAKGLVSNPFAQQFCTSRFPIKPTTVTASTAETTTSIVLTTQTISTTFTDTEFTATTLTDQATTTTVVTNVETDIVTNTITSISSGPPTATSTSYFVTSAGGTAVYKRAPEITSLGNIQARAVSARGGRQHGYANNPRAQAAYKAFGLFSASKGAAFSIASTVCNCVETTRTLTTTSTSTATAVSTNVVSETEIITESVTITSFSTTTATATDTSFTTSITTVTTDTTTVSSVPGGTAIFAVNACGQRFGAPLTGTPILILCGENSSSGSAVRVEQVVSSFNDCLAVSDADGASTAFTFQYSTGICRTYQQDTGAHAPNPDFVYGGYYL